ncbi:ABC transporter substrate-binding protein [Aureimonas leprariae]|uniref:Spermidine/putrescine ABC transporter substrate-binding protein n=1 Tax=Plantimonas leprariae TaxID=2615207 RepID=A0A7V7TVP4_9HYPH|nr:spermidine/putrescine ABC transporter substrate-binding protein [Aureimonas leprariae]KAB0678527.1 spermidine/putrescine ABC transporter substrate-binding protein [Aureimonas leprariae]
MLDRLRLSAIVLLVLSPLAAKAETLNLLTWEKYISPRVLDAWRTETDSEIRQIYFDSAEGRDRILSDGNSEIDLAILNENATKLFRNKGMLQEISAASVPAIGYSVPRWRERCSGYGMPYFWGTLGIVYRADKTATPPTSWADLMQPAAELAGHIAMMGGSDDLLTPTLILAGKSVNTQSEADLKAAYASLRKQAPAVRTYDYVVTSLQNEAIGPELFMALAYSGDQFVLKGMDGHDWRYALPKEGSVLWVDCMAVTAASPRRALALRFLDFLNRPEISAMNAADLTMPTTNAAAMPLLPAAMREDAAIFPEQALIDNSHFYEENSAAVVQTRKRMLHSLLSFHDAR